MKQSRRRIFAWLLAAGLTLGMLSGCSEVTPNSEPESSEEVSEPVSSEPESSEEVSSEPETVEGNQNPLTGLYDLSEDAVGKRPVAIMINNIKIALPQSGISQADIMYEMVVEGGITRMMAVYSDYNAVPTTGSIRSARHNYLELALPHDAIYVHFGGSNIAYDKIKAYGLTDDLDGLKNMTPFTQDKALAASKGQEHSFYTTGALLSKGIAAKNIRTESKVTSTAFNFAKEYTAASDAEGCSAISVPFSNYVTAKFTYNADTDSYDKQQFGAAHMDANTGKAASVHNVFVLYTNIYTMDKKGHQQIDLNSGSGYYCTGGKYQKISWSKNGVNAPIVYKDASGNELSVSAGNSWVCIVSDKQKSNTKITP